jgi:ABC-2 type transport system permease protein
MNRIVLKKALIEVRLLFAACAATLFAFCWLRVWIVSRLEMSSFAQIIEQLWDKWKDFSPVPLSQLLSYAGRIAMGYDEPIVVFTVAIFAVARGSDAVAGELNRGSMEMLLAQPVSRLQVLYSQAVVTVGALLLLAFASWAGTWAGIQAHKVVEEEPPPSLKIPGFGFEIPLSFSPGKKITVPMRERVDAMKLLPGAVNLFALGFCWAGIATLVSSADRYRWRTIGIVSTLFVLQLIAKIAGLAIPKLRWLSNLTVFTAYEPQKYVSVAVNMPDQTWAMLLRDSQGQVIDLGPLGYNLILVGIGAVCYLAAGAVFHRRDLPAPL